MEKPLKILLLEDSRLDAEIIERLLVKEISHCEFKLAMNKKAFLGALDEFIPDVILSDNSLPRFNATEALAIVRDRSWDVPFILITGTVSEEYAAGIIKQGADDYILKDRMARLPGAIEAAMRIRQIEKEKRKAAERLKHSEENYRAIMERLSDAFVAMGKDWIYTYVNKTAGEIMHRKPEELVGKCIWTEFPEGIGLPFHTAYFKAMEEQRYIHLEEYYQPLNVWLENHIYPSPDGLSVFFRDITEQKESEQKIIQSEENLKAIFDNSSEGFILLDEQGLVKSFNERAVHGILVHSESGISIGKSIFDLVEPARQVFFKNIFSRVLGGEVIQYDRSYSQKNNKVTWINFSFNPVRKGTLIKGICITGRDITEKKLAEQQEEFDHNNLTALINNTRDLMWSVDRSFKLITFNQAFDDAVKLMSGITLVKGTDILAAAFNKEQLQRYKKYYERAFAGEMFTEVEFNSLPVESWSEISFYPIYEKREVIGTACFSRDITDRIKSEEKLRQLAQEKLESKIVEQKKITRAMLIAQEKERNAIGIELHDNVNQILVGTNLLLSMAKSNPKNIQDLITSSIGHLQEAIQENRKIAHEFVAPDLDTESLVAQLQKLAGNMLETSDLQVRFTVHQFNEGLLDADRKFNIYRIAQEQCTNIVKYARAKTVSILLFTSKDLFEMIISDDGIGMDVNKQGKGIGLRNIKNRLDLFEGTVTINTAPSKGFALKISIPLATKP